MIRQPAVAGKFYTDDPDQLRAELAALIPRGDAARVLGVVAPHAGYVYSGQTAGLVYGAVQVPEAVLVLGPNHTGIGAPAALAPSGEWITPLGPVPINSRLSKLILKHGPMVREDLTAHRSEHSLEVQLPFLQHCNPRVCIAALCLSLSDYDSIHALGSAIAKAVAEYGDQVLIVASSDMNHYESASVAKEKDDLALARLTALDPEGLFRVCRERRISMCGVVPAAVMLVAAMELGASTSRIIGYTTSGAVNGDLSRVVAYAAVTVS
jgi:MEMO1 family protein